MAIQVLKVQKSKESDFSSEELQKLLQSSLIPYFRRAIEGTTPKNFANQPKTDMALVTLLLGGWAKTGPEIIRLAIDSEQKQHFSGVEEMLSVLRMPKMSEVENSAGVDSEIQVCLNICKEHFFPDAIPYLQNCRKGERTIAKLSLEFRRGLHLRYTVEKTVDSREWDALLRKQ